MIKIMIVDDETLIRQWLLMCLNHIGIASDMIDEASNGEEALSLLENCVYDLIFTDITMPKLNGIDLIKEIRQKDANVPIIILTCHNDFSFARAAIKYNVYEYLMKNELSQSDIERIAVRFLKPMIEQKEHSLIRNNFMNTLLGDLSFEKINFSDLQDHFIFLSDAPCFALALDCHEPGICNNLMDNEKVSNTVSFYDENHLTIFVCNLNEKMDSSEVIGKISSKLLRSWNNKRHIGVSRLYDSPCFLPLILKEAVSNWEYIFFHGDDKEKIPNTSTLYTSSEQQLKQKIRDMKDKILFVFSTLGIDSCKEQTFALCNFFKEHHIYDSNILKRTINEIIIGIENKLSANFHSINYETGRITNSSYFTELISYLKEFFENIPSTYNIMSTIREAQEYIILHYNEPISLKTLAHKVFLSEEYFSRLFKKETGQTFTDYLMSIRMDRAYKLLLNSNLNINEIAEMVGIPNPSYFSSQFKKYYKISPKDVRK